MKLPNECDFAPETAPEALLQETILKITEMPDWLIELVRSGDIEPILGHAHESLRLKFYALRRLLEVTPVGVFEAMGITSDPVVPDLDSRATEYAELNDQQAARIAELERAAQAVVATHDEILPVMNAYMRSLGIVGEWERTCSASDNLRKALAAIGDAQPASVAEVKLVAWLWRSFDPDDRSAENDGWILSMGSQCPTYKTNYETLALQAAAPTPPQQPRQESEIAAEALEEAAKLARGATAYTQFQTVEHYKIAKAIETSILGLAAQKREQAK